MKTGFLGVFKEGRDSAETDKDVVCVCVCETRYYRVGSHARIRTHIPVNGAEVKCFEALG